MTDLVFIVIAIAFFALCVGYVHLCDRIIGPDPVTRDPDDPATADRLEEVPR